MITGPGQNLDARRWKASRDSLKFAAHSLELLLVQLLLLLAGFRAVAMVFEEKFAVW